MSKFFKQLALFFIMLSYPLLSMLWRYEYPLLSVEALLFFTSLLFLSLLLAVLTFSCRPLLTNVIIAFAVVLTLVLQFDLLFEGFVVLLAGIVALVLTLGGKFPQFALAVFVALIIGARIDSGLKPTKDNSQAIYSDSQTLLPPIVHIVLDEFIGPDGLPPQDAPQALRSDILGFFERNDFELYNRAYSHYHTSQDSLFHAFNFTNSGATPALEAEIFHTDLVIKKNRYFRLLHQLGYKINIYQTAWVDFCQAEPEAVGRCVTYKTPALNAIPENVHSPWVRLRILATNLFKQSKMISLFLSKNGWLHNWGLSLYEPDVIDDIGDALEQSRGGAYFAHLLLPHGPLVYDSDCRLDYSSDPWERLGSTGLETNTEYSRAVRYLRYLPQVKCALKEVERLFDRMRELDLYDDAIILVHSDHGSRISLHSAHKLNKENLTPEDYRDLYSTLFAIKLPKGEYREYSETVSLNVLLSRAVMEIAGEQRTGPDFRLITEDIPFIYLSGQIPLLKKEIDIFTLQ